MAVEEQEVVHATVPWPSEDSDEDTDAEHEEDSEEENGEDNEEDYEEEADLLANGEKSVNRAIELINHWYAVCRPRFIDLVGDYAGRELFLLEGDSLLRECFSDERIDFQEGFQMLHAAFVVERFLENLVKRHCQFHIAFFDQHSDSCIPAGVSKLRQPRYLLARSIVIRHLQIHLPKSSGIQIHVFPSLNSDVFDHYLAMSPIHFVMAHDGALPATGVMEEETELDRHVKALQRVRIRWFTQHGLNIALINRVEFRDSKVFTMILESDFAARRIDKRQEELLSILVPKLIEEKPQEYSFDAPKIDINAGEWLANLKLQDVFATARMGVSEVWYLTAYTLSTLLPHCADTLLGSAVALHMILIKYLPLSKRRLPLISFDSELEKSIRVFLSDFSKMASRILVDHQWANTMHVQDAECNVIDFFDGRLFRVAIQAILEGSLEHNTQSAIKNDWSVISKAIQAASGKSISLEKLIESHTYNQEHRTIEDMVDLPVMPFSNPVFDKHLACIHVATDSTIPAQFASMKLYRETTHWHNRRPLVVKQPVALKVSKRNNPLRTNQFYMAEMTAYAASLTGAKGKALEPETVTVGIRKLAKPVETTPKTAEPTSNTKKGSKEDKVVKPEATLSKSELSSSAKKGGKKQAAGLTKAQQIIADNKEKKGGAESDKAFSAWATVMKGLNELSSDQERYLRGKTYLDSLDSTKSVHIEAEVNLYLLQTLLAWWAKYCKAEKKAEGYHVVAMIWTLTRATCSSNGLTKDIAQHLEKTCTILSITNAMSANITNFQDRKLSFVFNYPANSQTLQIGVSQVEFQLLHVGPYMDRFLDAQPDPRVSSFTPDGWQRKVLDELDADHSVFVVAPTSAGKTFISFYAMEQVLRADNDGVLVYVAPTKALVNQIAAEIQGRFSKRFPQAGKSVWAIHTRDYRVNNSTGCQILVTVPHILQIMLLAPTNAKAWAPRVRRIIFDEIHSIGQAEDGVVWEQLLLLAPCPIIALSATVGNPREFSDWLADTQKASRTKLTMIQHSTRYSDLRKYLYKPPTTFEFNGFGKSQGVHLGLDGLEGLTYFHPVASLIDRSRGMPNDLALEPRDCLLLWKAMCKFQTKEYPVPSKLDPAKALPSLIIKADIFKWEKELKELLLMWMNASRDSPFENVVHELSPSELSTDSNNERINSKGRAALRAGKTANVDPNDLLSTTLPLLFQLHKRGALPAILFNYDRSGCEKIAYNLLKQLKTAENTWKKSKEWQRKLDEWTKWKELKEKKAAKKPAKPSKKKGGDDDDKTSKADQAKDDASTDVTSFDLFDPEEPQDDFSFADKRRCQKTELESYIRQLRWKRVNERLITLLQRGIGVHHSGMNRKYRQCVEMLFRKGFLRVVVATGTLSLGINMPCATVVFSGDSVFLTALNFRQASGRSGRRGYDLLGNVVFQNISPSRVCRLLSSRLPDLTGHFPITTTLVLRLFTLLNDSKNAPYAVKAINSLLSQPRLYLGGESFKEQVLHHLRFSIEYLRRQSLLGPRGEPVNFTSCVSHLYFTENSSFAFHALLKDGYFKELCADIDTHSDQVLRTMMLVLSHLFGRQVCREVDDEATAELVRRSPSIVYLPPLPEDAATVLKGHNTETLSIFATYVKTFAEQHIHGEERLLPLTRVSVGGPISPTKEGDILSNTTNGSEVEKSNGTNNMNLPPKAIAFLPNLTIPRARSAFVALSGHGDDFSTINDLCTSVRSGIFLESAVIPHLELHPEESRVPLNAYLYDFFMHGSLQPLEAANGIRKSDVWFLLNDFSLVLATIVTSLAGYLGLGKGDVDDEILEVMGSGDRAENEGDEEMAAETSSVTTSMSSQSLASSSTSLGSGFKKSKKLADDWGADEDAMVAEEKLIEDGRHEKIGTDDEEYDELMKVYRAFRRLKTEFDGKFKEIWA